MASLKSKPELAKLGAVHRTIPKLVADISVTAVSATTTGSALAPYAGKWVFLYSTTLDVTVALGARTVVAGKGTVVRVTNDPQEFYIDPDDAMELSHISTGAATLSILYDA